MVGATHFLDPVGDIKSGKLVARCGKSSYLTYRDLFPFSSSSIFTVCRMTAFPLSLFSSVRNFCLVAACFRWFQRRTGDWLHEAEDRLHPSVDPKPLDQVNESRGRSKLSYLVRLEIIITSNYKGPTLLMHALLTTFLLHCHYLALHAPAFRHERCSINALYYANFITITKYPIHVLFYSLLCTKLYIYRFIIFVCI